ncbi:hypothetical protein Tco_1348398 [Tanacetum coccineum]
MDQKIVIASRVKKLEKTHDPLALFAHTSSSSRSPPAYYVTHPPYVVDYDDEWKRISEKRTENQAKTDKTEHGMEKRGKHKVKSKLKSTKFKVKKVKLNLEILEDL